MTSVDHRLRAFLTAAGAAALLLTGCAAGPPADAAVTPSSPSVEPVAATPPPPGRYVLRWQFDGPEPLVGLSGPGERWGAPQVAANNGGQLRRVIPGADGAGAAVGFPEVCTGEQCPRVAIKGPDYPELDPGTRPFTVGASVLIRRDQLTGDHGSNLVQKGLASSAQWKLQIDSGDEGRPSCVVRGTDGANPVVVVARDSVADGEWHRIVCRRTNDALEIVIDDAVTGTVPLSADYAIGPAGHLVAVGAKGAGPNNDQFHGLLDEIFFSLD